MKKFFILACVAFWSAYTPVFAQQGMGVGNSNPQEMLDVSGAIKVGNTTSTNTGTIRWNGTNFQGYDGTQWVDFGGGSGADSDWTLSGNNQSSAVSGNVGIGTTTPDQKLTIRVNNGSTALHVQGTSGTSRLTVTPSFSSTSIVSQNSYRLDLGVNSANALSIIDGGNVGFGETTPEQRLEINGNILLGIGQNDQFVHGANDMVMSADGHVAIVSDANDISGSANGGNIWFGSGSDVDLDSDRDAAFIDAFGQGRPRNIHMVINGGSGNVGLGTNSPSAKLDVVGTIQILDGTQGVGKVLTSDFQGNATWQTPAADGDSNSSNELQTLSQSGSTVTLSNGGGSVSVADNDNNSSNEIQSLSLSGSTLAISGSNNVSLAGFVNSDNQNLSSSTSGTNRVINISGGTGTTISVADNDNSSSNELQTLSQSGTTVTLSNGGGAISVADDDDNSSNEIQTLSLSGSTVSLSNGGGSVSIPSDAAFTTTANLTSNAPGTYATDDFVFGSPQLADDGNPDHDPRMFFDKSKGAFRAGWVFASAWDDINVGNRSVALGLNTTASGQASTAMGYNTIASGNYSTAIGIATTASASSCTAMGGHLTAESVYEMVVGMYNTDYTPNWVNGINGMDRLFVVGNGTSTSARSNALVILKNGNTGIGTSQPTQLLHLDGTAGTDGIKFPDGTEQVTAFDGSAAAFTTTSNVTSNAPGAYATDDFVFGSPQLADNGNTSHDARVFFDKSKGSFRAGRVTGTQWNDANVGDFSTAMGSNTNAGGYAATALGGATNASGGYSTAMGLFSIASGGTSTAVGRSTIASGDYAVAFGEDTEASGLNATAIGFNTTSSSTASVAMGYSSTAGGAFSTAFGRNTVASGTTSTAFGLSSTASGNLSTAFGSGTTASGASSIALGVSTTAESGYEMVVGRYNTDYSPSSTTGWSSNDRLFVIGNGTSSSNRSDAMVVHKSGRVGIGTSTNTYVPLYVYGTADASYSDASGVTVIGDINGQNLVMDGNELQARNNGGSNALRLQNDGGNVAVGLSGGAVSERLHVDGFVRATGYRCRTGANGAYGSNVFNFHWTGSSSLMYIDGVYVGQLQFTSDRRLKSNINSISTAAIDRVKQLNPVTFNYKKVEGTIFTGDDVLHEGFIADELQAVIPSAVNGEKDALTEKGTIQPQTVNNTPIISVLTKAIQEQQEMIDSQKEVIEQLLERVETLEVD